MRRSLAVLIGACAVLGTAGPAGADETRASADVSAGVGYSANPFSAGNGARGSAFAQAGVSPEIRILNERRVIAIGGDLFYQDYFRDYSSTASYQARADYSERLSQQTSVHGRVGYQSARLGTFGFGGLGGAAGGTLNPVVVPPVTTPVTGVGAGAGLLNPGIGVPVLPGAEVGAFGAGQRQRTFTANGDFSSAISTRTTLTGSAFYLRSDFGGRSDLPGFGRLGDYSGYGATLGAQRSLSERTSVGVTGSVSSYDYVAGRSDSRVYSIQGTVSTRLSPLWSLDAALGVSLVDQQTGGNATTLSGSANACRRGERSTTCFQVSRSVLPTGFAGTQVQTSGGVTWVSQLGQYDNLSLAASYVDLSSGGGELENLGGFDNRYALANLGYSRNLGRRLRFTPSLYYRKVFGGSFQRGDDYGGQVGLSYRLGDLR